MCLVLQQGDLPAVVVVTHDALEHHDRPRAPIGHRALVGPDVQRLGGHADHAASSTSSGRGTSGTSVPSAPLDSGAITANPTAPASPRSIEDPAWLTGRPS